MKILHINCNYMGTPLHQIMIEHLDGLTDNDVFCPIHEDSLKATSPNENVTVSECFRKSDRYFFYLKQHKIKNAVSKAYRIKDYDLVHAYTLFTDGNVAFNIKNEYGIPYVVAVRSTDLFFFKMRVFLRKRGIEILQNASAVFFLSEPAKKTVLETYVPKSIRGIIEEKSYIIPNGIDDFWLEHPYSEKQITDVKKRVQEKQVSIVCVAQIIRRKNIPVIQEAIKNLNEQGWNISLDVVGKPVDQKLLERIKQDDNTSYHPPVNKEKLIDYYRSADIFALASLSETFGLVYAEAMTQGLPVIYTRGEGFDGQFPDGVVGFAVDSDDSEEIAKAIKQIVDKYDVFFEKSLKLAKKFDWKNIVYKYYKIYQNILMD